MIYPPFYDQIQFLITGVMFFFLMAAFFKPALAAGGYLILMVFRPMQVYPVLGAMRLELIVCLYIAVLIMIRQRAERVNPDYHPLNKALLLFFLVALISVVQAFNISASWDFYYNQYFHMFVFFVMIVCLSDKIGDAKLLIFIYLAMVAWLTYLPIYNHLIGFGKMRGDVLQSVGETFGVHSHVAQANLMTQTIPFAYFFMIWEKNKIVKILLGFSFILFISANVVSGSRGGFLGLVVCAFLFTYKAKRRSVAFLALGLLALGATALDSSYWEWMSTILDFGASDVSAHSRLDGLRNGIDMLMRRPILGVGVGCFALARKAWFGWGIWAHNLYGEILGEVGLLGAISWGWLIFLCFREIKRIRVFMSGREDVSPVYGAITDACWATLIVRLVLGMTTHCMFAYIWYFIASILIVTSKTLANEYPEFAVTTTEASNGEKEIYPGNTLRRSY